MSTQLSYILKALFMDTPLAYNLCSSDGQVADGQMARWPGDRWPGSQVTGCRWYEKMINKINNAEKKTKGQKSVNMTQEGSRKRTVLCWQRVMTCWETKSRKQKSYSLFPREPLFGQNMSVTAHSIHPERLPVIILLVCMFVNFPSDNSAVFIIQVQSTIR